MIDRLCTHSPTKGPGQNLMNPHRRAVTSFLRPKA